MPFQASYVRLPDEEQWKRDAYITSPETLEPVSRHILFLVGELNRKTEPGILLRLVGDLYFSLDYWLEVEKGTKRNPLNRPMTPKELEDQKLREPAMSALRGWTLTTLRATFRNCSPNDTSQLEDQISMVFGREMSRYGRQMDMAFDQAWYASNRAAIESYRIFFDKGRAYQFAWWEYEIGPRVRGDLGRIVPAESQHAYSEGGFLGGPGWNYGNFVMTMDREIFMYKHSLERGQHASFFHSSYVAGRPVLSAGEMLIESGIIKAIKCSSGHYQPKPLHMVNLLDCLLMHEVSIGAIDLYSRKNEGPFKAPEYLVNYQRIDLDEPGYTNYTYLSARADRATGTNPLQKTPRPKPGSAVTADTTQGSEAMNYKNKRRQ